ncbi:hypothetical protein DA2_2445 [Desulfovibrio sp. A2]|nr:hypothetical protein DA2_2445 [Desulfovibrio sp. A2]
MTPRLTPAICNFDGKPSNPVVTRFFRNQDRELFPKSRLRRRPKNTPGG